MRKMTIAHEVRWEGRLLSLLSSWRFYELKDLYEDAKAEELAES